MNNIHCIVIIIIISYIQSSSDTSNYLKIDILESTNLHCKNNNEFYCNPYAIVQLKRNGDKISTSTIKCTKHPQWMSSFIFHPSLCKDIIYINFFQYFTQRDKEYFGASPENMNFIIVNKESPRLRIHAGRSQPCHFQKLAHPLTRFLFIYT